MDTKQKPLNVDWQSHDGELLLLMINYVERNPGSILNNVIGFLGALEVSITTDARHHEAQPLHVVRRNAKQDPSDPDTYTITFSMTSKTSMQDVARSLAASAKWIAQRMVLPAVFAWETLQFDCASELKRSYELPVIKDAVLLGVYSQLDIHAFANKAVEEMEKASRMVLNPVENHKKISADQNPEAPKEETKKSGLSRPVLIRTGIKRIEDTLDDLRVAEAESAPISDLSEIEAHLEQLAEGQKEPTTRSDRSKRNPQKDGAAKSNNQNVKDFTKPFLKLNAFSISNAVMAQVMSSLWKGYDEFEEKVSGGNRLSAVPQFEDAVETADVKKNLDIIRNMILEDAPTLTRLEQLARDLSDTTRMEDPKRKMAPPRGARSMESYQPGKPKR